jgi:hypothetical protein
MRCLEPAAVSVDDYRNGVTRVIDKQFVSAQMRLPHRDGKALPKIASKPLLAILKRFI